ncbi:hypothetical protein ACIQVE_03940 [Pseudomonas sp. NPDC098747]|uniref:hypothetical protein n=1 Tax=Pseudomonas sp. NPDC098747 TaxID=3364487 RepID=UPI00383B06F9
MLPLLQNLCANAICRSIRALVLVSFTLLGSGCAMFSNTTTLKTDLPARFSVFTTAHYSPLLGGVCLLPEDYAGDPEPDKKRFYSESHPAPFTSTFEVNVSYNVADCLPVLSGFTFLIQGQRQHGQNEKEYGTSTVFLEVETFLREDEELATRIDEQVLEVRCYWRGPARDSGARQQLKCFGVDANGKERKGPQLGVLKNRQLQGLTLRLQVSVMEANDPS